MKNILFAGFLGLSTIIAVAQSNDEQAVAAAVEKLRMAMIDGNKATLESLASDALSYGHSSGLVQDKAAFVEAIASGKNDFTKIDQTNQTIQVMGKIAIVRHIFKAELLVDGKSASPNIGIMLIWQKEKNQWKLLARQAYKL